MFGMIFGVVIAGFAVAGIRSIVTYHAHKEEIIEEIKEQLEKQKEMLNKVHAFDEGSSKV